MARVFKERTGGAEPTAHFSLDVQEVTRTFVLYDDLEESQRDANLAPLPQDVYDKVTETLGTTLTGIAPGAPKTPGGAGSIQRLLPRADALYPSLFADDVSVSVSAGEAYQLGNQEALFLAVPPLDRKYARYYGYNFVIHYSGRPYAIVPNDRIWVEEIEYFDTDGTPLRAYLYEEIKRYTAWFTKALDSRLTATHGSAMKFRVGPGELAGINGAAFQGVPEMAIPDALVTARVWGVPKRWLDSPNSYLNRLRSRINAVDWKVSNKRTFKKGSLLYLGFDVLRTYVPPRFTRTVDDDPALDGSFSIDALVDLDLNFIHTTRVCAASAPAGTLTNPNFLGGVEGQGTHNDLPFLPTRDFFLATSDQGIPSYFSDVFQKLLNDPDVPELIGPR